MCYCCLPPTACIYLFLVTPLHASFSVRLSLQLSLGGKLALAFGALMDKLWRGGVGHVSPKLFKWQLAKFCPQFSGYAQEDSQELLAFLLDGLHEVRGQLCFCDGLSVTIGSRALSGLMV